MSQFITLASRDLRYSVFCVSSITAKIWLNMILYHNICRINNVSLFLSKVELSLSTQADKYVVMLQIWIV